jgi:Fe-S-cluster-containing dehydrogenase component
MEKKKHTTKCSLCGKFIQNGITGMVAHKCKKQIYKPLDTKDLKKILEDLVGK